MDVDDDDNWVIPESPMPLSHEDYDDAGVDDIPRNIYSPLTQNGTLVGHDGSMVNATTGSPMLTNESSRSSESPMTPLSSFRQECSRVADTHSPLSNAYVTNSLPFEVTMHMNNGIKIPIVVPRQTQNTYKKLIQSVDREIRQRIQDCSSENCTIWYGTADAREGRLTIYEPVLIPNNPNRRLICKMHIDMQE